jgi:hypothetical protein
VKLEEIVYAVLQPHFDAVRDVFLAYSPAPGVKLDRLKKIKFIIDPKVGRGGSKLPGCDGRHFAATRDDGRVMYYAPDIVSLPVQTLVAILAHEFGHAADHAYPAHWMTPPQGTGSPVWVTPEDTKRHRTWQRLWRDRTRDQIEWSADSIAELVTGRKIGYCGDCMLQCFSGGEERPAGLR